MGVQIVAAVADHLVSRRRALLLRPLLLPLLLPLPLLIAIIRVRYAGERGGGGHDDRRRHGEHEEARDEKCAGNPRKRGVGGSGRVWQVNRWWWVAGWQVKT